MKLQENPVIKNLARILGIKDVTRDEEATEKINQVLNEVEKKFGVRHNTEAIRHWFSGKRKNPDMKILSRIADVKDIKNVWDLWAPEDFIKLDTILDASNLNQDKKYIIKMVLEMTDKLTIDSVLEHTKMMLRSEKTRKTEKIEKEKINSAEDNEKLTEPHQYFQEEDEQRGNDGN